MQCFMNSANHRVAEKPNTQLKLPHDYKYKDGKPGDVVEPKVIFGTQPDLSKFDGNPRAAFASWLTADDNPRFALTIANRMWKHVFGLGVIEPVHDLKDLSTAQVPGLPELLAAEMKRVHYDLREFQRILFLTRAWQREASTTPLARGEPYAFPGPVLRRLTATQIWDSVLTMILDDPDYYNGKRDYLEWEKTYSMDRATVTGKEMGMRFAKMEALNQQDGGAFGWPKDEESLRPKGTPLYIDPRINVWRLYGDVLVRASELPQPSNLNHLLRSLGQSDRVTIDSDSTVGSVPISLALMNGRGSQVITKNGSRLMNAVDKFKADGPKVETVFLSILSRMPRSDERSTAYKAIRQGGKSGYEDVAWALLNTREFLFVQ